MMKVISSKNYKQLVYVWLWSILQQVGKSNDSHKKNSVKCLQIFCILTKKVINFYFNRCGPCQRIAPHFEQLPTKYPRAVFLKVDVDKCQDTAAAQGVSAMPTFFFYRNKVKFKQTISLVRLERKVSDEFLILLTFPWIYRQKLIAYKVLTLPVWKQKSSNISAALKLSRVKILVKDWYAVIYYNIFQIQSFFYQPIPIQSNLENLTFFFLLSDGSECFYNKKSMRMFE